VNDEGNDDGGQDTTWRNHVRSFALYPIDLRNRLHSLM
jgi:hypothetical protein